MTHPPRLSQNTQTAISRQLYQLRREIERLSIRIVAVTRYQRQMSALASAQFDEEVNSYEDVAEHLDALISDMTTYHQQLEDRVAHIAQGYASVQAFEQNVVAQAFEQYIYDDVRMLVRDAKVAREGYNDLIANIIDTIEQSE